MFNLYFAELNFCEENPNTCQHGGRCTSLIKDDGYFRCECPSGYRGRTCQIMPPQMMAAAAAEAAEQQSQQAAAQNVTNSAAALPQDVVAVVMAESEPATTEAGTGVTSSTATTTTTSAATAAVPVVTVLPTNDVQLAAMMANIGAIKGEEELPDDIDNEA